MTASPPPAGSARILGSYIDGRELAAACRLGIERDGLGCEPLIVAADDSSSNRRRASSSVASRLA